MPVSNKMAVPFVIRRVQSPRRFPAIPADAVVPAPDFRRLSADELISGLAQPGLRAAARQEIYRRIGSNLATNLAVKFLLHSPNDGFDGLVALCWRARGNLYLFPAIGEAANRASIVRCTREFIEEFVLEYFERYQNLNEAEILRAALADKFRYIGRRFKSRLIDQVRKRQADKNQIPFHVSLDTDEFLDENDEAFAVGADGRTAEQEAKPQSPDATAIHAFLEPRREKLRATLGETNCEVLDACLDIYPDGYEGTRPQCESALTEAIRRRRLVSAQQARADKRRFRGTVSREVERGNQELRDLYSFLDRGDDDDTLRLDFITPRGRKTSLKLRIKLSSAAGSTDKAFGREIQKPSTQADVGRPNE